VKRSVSWMPLAPDEATGNMNQWVPFRHIREWRYSSTILDLGTRWWWVVSFTPGRSRSTRWIGGSVGPRAGVDALEERKIFPSVRNRTPAVQSVARRYTDWAIPTPIILTNMRTGFVLLRLLCWISQISREICKGRLTSFVVARVYKALVWFRGGAIIFSDLPFTYRCVWMRCF
jgi:hypothetical protein